MVKNKDAFRALPIKERAALINTYVSGGVMDLGEMRRHYNSFSPGGPIETDEYGYPADIAPAVIEADYPRENEVWKRADASNADMIQRLKQGSSRVTIQDWEDPRRVATHKMMSAGKYAVGNVQNINGQLFDFTDPKHGFEDSDRAAIDSAIRRGDYIEFDTEGDARYFAEHYKKHYNSFGSGGDTDGDGNIVLDWIRKQLYDKIDPVGYDYFVDRVKAAVLGKGEDRYNKARDDIFATYLKIPKDERHNAEGAKKVSDATYTPTKSSEDTNYHKIDLTDKEKDALIYDALRSNANVGDSSRSHVFEQFFGPHQVSRGKDEKGEYVSYYDLWDLDPSSGESKVGEFEFLKSLQEILGAKDMSLGIGEPVEFYDRIYLNDYYGVTPQIDEGVIEGGYIQPAYIEASAGTSSTLTGEDYYNAGENSLPVYSKGGKLNVFDIGGDKDTWYKRLYSWIFNDNNAEETTPQENKYLTNDNYLDEVSKFISTFEEFYPNAYEDTHKGKNIWTVGSGLTYLLDDEGNEIKVKKGDTITKEENINQLNKRLQKNIDYVKSKTQYWDNYPAELKFQLLDAMYNIGAPKVWNPETNYIKAIRQYENEKGWENPEYDLKNIFQHADWNLNNKGWLGIRSRMRRNPQSINVEDFSKIYQNDYRDSLKTAYDLKFQNN